MSESGLAESRFYQWRALVAMAHVDGEMASEELALLQRFMKTLPLSDGQRTTLEEDIKKPQDPLAMLEHVTDQTDLGEFFFFARMIIAADHIIRPEEKEAMDSLKNLIIQKKKDDAAAIDDVVIRMLEKQQVRITDEIDEGVAATQAHSSVGPFFIIWALIVIMGLGALIAMGLNLF